MNNSKQKTESSSDMNNNKTIEQQKKKLISEDKKSYSLGQIKEVNMINFMCHKNFSVQFHPTHMQIVTGANGSGKSTIANAICLSLGASARTTGRTSNVQSFIRKGETFAQLTITLANEGPEAYKPELYGNEIKIIRRIGSRQSGYKILGTNRKTVSIHKETIDEITQALSITPENPLCVLHQEIAKHFLMNNDIRKKYHFYMKVSQLDQMKQAYEQCIHIVQGLFQRVNIMKEKHIGMLRELGPLEFEVKKIEFRRNYEEKRRVLEAELITARADQTQQEILLAQYQFDEAQKNKEFIDNQIIEENNKIVEIKQILENFITEKNDLKKDINGLRDLISHFAKQKQDFQFKIHSFAQECEEYRRTLTDIELEQIRIQQQIDKYDNLNLTTDHSQQIRSDIEHEISIRQAKQTEYDKIITSLLNDIDINDDNIREKQLALDCLENKLKQSEKDLNELFKIDQDKINVYGLWMSDCLKAIQNEERFHKKPIGPIGRHIHCIEPYWSYAVEKHLGAIMSSFICSDNHDEKLLLDLFSLSACDIRPPVYVRSYSDKIHDISGTLEQIKKAKLLSIYDVLKIDNMTVACALIDFRQIEATILVENLEQVKQIRQSEILTWNKVDRKVKQVFEAWTSDGSNIKFDKTFRIYTNDKQSIKYFLTNHTQSLTIEELEFNIKNITGQIKQIKHSINKLKKNQQTTNNDINEMTTGRTENKLKIEQLIKELECLNSTIPMINNFTLDELQEKAKNYLIIYNDAVRKYDETKEKKDDHVQKLVEIVENYENMIKKFDNKTQEYDLIVEKHHLELSKHNEIHQLLNKLKNKALQFNEEMNKYQIKLTQLNKKKPKKYKPSSNSIRSVCEIQRELDVIQNYLKINQDTNEQRRDIIHNYRIKRDAVKDYKQTYERCCQQIENLNQFINKRQERFLTIAEQHQYYLRIKFQNLMKKYQFDDCDIRIDHKNEELEIIIQKDQRDLASLSGGERSVSTFCFLLALWESIYQPFRLLDEIDIYMDNEKFSSSLEVLYQNTLNYSPSQHIIFTPQTIDVQLWNKLNVPVFNMPTPKRSLE